MVMPDDDLGGHAAQRTRQGELDVKQGFAGGTGIHQAPADHFIRAVQEYQVNLFLQADQPFIPDPDKKIVTFIRVA